MFSRYVKKFGILYRLEWRRKWQPTPVFLPGKSHGQRSLVGYSSWGHKESDTTEQTYTHTHTYRLEMYYYFSYFSEWYIKAHYQKFIIQSIFRNWLIMINEEYLGYHLVRRWTRDWNSIHWFLYTAQSITEFVLFIETRYNKEKV